MLLIGERINVITKVQRDAMQNRDPKPIQEIARAQVDAGANVLDINIGPAEDDGPELMDWIVKTVQEVVQVPLCLDTTNLDAIRAGLKAHNNEWGRAIINSTSGETVRLNTFMPVAAEFQCDIIGLCLAGSGLPADANERAAIAVDIMGKAMEVGLPVEHIHLDPLVLMLNGNQEQAMQCINAVEMFQDLNDPPMKTVVGLSNIANTAPAEMKGILTAVFYKMLVDAGLTGAIIDTLEKEFMEVVRTNDPTTVYPADQVEKTMKVMRGEIMYAHSYLDI
jgi:5-methyltetrahydrofolate corrinoid/iron sulfur protein methyltransferase